MSTRSNKDALKLSAPLGSSLVETISTLRWCGAAHRPRQLKHVGPAAEAAKGLWSLFFVSWVCVKTVSVSAGLLPADGGQTDFD